MKHMGAIRKVTESSQWCAGVVTVPKSTGVILVNPLNQGLQFLNQMELQNEVTTFMDSVTTQ